MELGWYIVKITCLRSHLLEVSTLTLEKLIQKYGVLRLFEALTEHFTYRPAFPWELLLNTRYQVFGLCQEILLIPTVLTTKTHKCRISNFPFQINHNRAQSFDRPQPHCFTSIFFTDPAWAYLPLNT